MSTEVLEAVDNQPEGRVALPMMVSLTPEESLLLRFFRQLREPDQLFMLRAIEAMATPAQPT
jgi:hypothetical protein